MGYAAALLAFLIWGTVSTILVRAVPLPGPVITNAATMVAACIMIVALGLQGRLHDVRDAFRAHRNRLLGLAALFAGTAGTFQWSVKTTTVANATLTHAAMPILACLFFFPLYGRPRPDARGYAALGVGIVGLCIVVWSGLAFDGHWFGIALGTISAVFYAWYVAHIALVSADVKQDVMQCSNLCCASLFMLPFSVLSCLMADAPVAFPDAGGIAKIVVIGACSFCGANQLYLYAQRKAPPDRVAMLSYTEPVIAVLAAAFWLQEPITAYHVVGGTIIIVSGIIAVSTRKA
jgi:drug/metabolite transporter (DMT)-like permease